MSITISFYLCVNKTVTQSQNWHNTALFVVQVPWKSSEKWGNACSQRCSLGRGQAREALWLHWCWNVGTLAELFGGEMFCRPTRKEREDAQGGCLFTTPSLWVLFLEGWVTGPKVFDLGEPQEYWKCGVFERMCVFVCIQRFFCNEKGKRARRSIKKICIDTMISRPASGE